MSDDQTQPAPVIHEAQQSREHGAASFEAGGAHPAGAPIRRSFFKNLMWPAFLLNRETYWFALVFLGGLFRMGHILLYQGPMDHIFSDPHRHLDNARHFLAPGPMGCSNPYFYQLFLYIVIKLTKEQRLWVHIIAAVLSGLYPYVWYRFARTVMVRRVNALRFTAVLTFLPTHSIIFTYFMNETLILPLVGASLWASSVAAQRSSAWRFILAAVLWTCAILTRSVSVPLAALMLLYALYHQRGRLPLWRPFLGFVAASIAGAGLWVAAQHSVRIFEYATPFGDNATASIYMVSGAKIYESTYMKPKGFRATYSFSSPSFYISPFDPFYEWHSVRKGTFKYTTNVETHGRDLKEIWWQQFKAHRKLLPRLVFENLIFLAFGHSWPEAGKGSLLGEICLQERWIWLPITLTSVLGSLIYMYRRRRLYLAPAIVVYATVVLYSLQMVVMEGRYRKPIEPLLVLGIFWLLDAIRNPATRRGHFRSL